MLVLTRRPGEDIVIGDDIVVTVTEIRGDNVRIAIEAPRAIKIYRGEIYKAIVNENKEAAKQGNQIDALKHLEFKNLETKKIDGQ